MLKKLCSFGVRRPGKQSRRLSGYGVGSETRGKSRAVFDLLRRIAGLRNEKERKNAPISHCRSRIIHNPTAS